MKKFIQKLLMLAVVGSLGFLYSCNDEETLPDLPTVSSTTDKTTYTVGEVVEISITFTTPGKFSGFNYTIFVDGAQSGSKVFNSPTDIPGTTTEDLQGDFTLRLTNITTASLVGSTVSIEFEVVDRENQIGTDEVTFSVTTPPSPTAKVQTAIILAAPLGDGSSSSFYSVAENKLYTHNEVVGTANPVSANIDLCYYYGNTDKATIVSPSEFPSAIFDISAWGTKNETAMVQLTDMTAEEFMALETVKDVEDALAPYAEADAFLGFSDLEVESIIAFETSGGKLGIFIVKSINEGFTGNIEIEMILAEAGE